MNVIVANEKQTQLAALDVDIIKSIVGNYEALEIVEMFKSFFYNKMILDVTAIKNYGDLVTYEKLVKGLDPDKIIFLLPEGSNLCTPRFLSHLISIGIYNFTTNINGVKYLLKKPNTLKDVEHIQKMVPAAPSFVKKQDGQKEKEVEKNDDNKNNINTSNQNNRFINESNKEVANNSVVIGIKSVTDGAGATTFIYLLKKELGFVYGNDNIVCLEIDKNDFSIFKEKNMVSIKHSEIKSALMNYGNKNIILVDLNDYNDDSICKDILYLIEPSTIKLNKLVMKNKKIFASLNDKKVILNKSLLLNNDVFDLEKETGIRVFYNIPPLDERKRNAVINDFLSKLGLLNANNRNGGSSNKIFGLFRR